MNATDFWIHAWTLCSGFFGRRNGPARNSHARGRHRVSIGRCRSERDYQLRPGRVAWGFRSD
ncbi:hypothetical protein ppKF707_0625 [Metapseudomonas furukawaii]|uniref:Uncharacterized protein n=1 Tax=Metapseudomonas furukawaii TaxID=1149133 RepID=A0AAD1BXH3_METFU|nr:hypothetical protein ppKF707_0625 [Pseudomonas furukawaii]BAU73007.1 hypothetical protein KF707C_13190 [Pseudomonas furukawaii]